MAELVLSALLTVVFEKLTSAAVNKVARSKGIHSKLKKLKEELFRIQALLEDASEKEVKSKAVKEWLNDLQHLAYDIDDILDALATDAMEREFVNEPQPITNKVRKFIPSCCTSFLLSTRVGNKLDEISTRLQDLMDAKVDLGLSEKLGLIVKNEGSKDLNRSNETSLLVGPIFGREDDKKTLVRKLLSDESCNENFGVVPIVGMGGIGKTTLAKLLYNDQLVQNHFELKAWVCVSDDFDCLKISKVIYQKVGGEQKDLVDLDKLQGALRDRLMGKRFLLVLDDVWSEKLEDWERLATPFSKVAPGSKIIITTRKQQLLNNLGCDHPYDLKELSPKDAVSLFARYAGINDFESYPMLRQHGEGIVNKCDGLPLALKALGSSLRRKRNEEDWKQLLEDEIWMLKDGGGILPALRLSYRELSACCKQLFAYCCLIPKDCVFEKKELILWWMAEGFLHNSATNKSMERLGEEYFQELLSRSFFQHVPDDESLFVMHDLMNDLATFVAGEFFSRLDIDMEKNVGQEAFKKYRHMSFVCEKHMTYKKFKAYEGANSLRTFLAMPNVVRHAEWRQEFYLSSKILVDILPQLPLLRVLSLSGLEIDEVPECVSNMKHLRYLNLSRTRITQLPESLCNLYNLQTLIVSGCDRLTKLPDNFLKLKNLRHFDIRDTLLWNMMPLGISKMKSLQTLSDKVEVVENNDSFISWLRNLKNLQAEIYIDELQKLQSASGIQGVNLSQKRVSKLHVEWRRESHMEWRWRWRRSNVFDDSRNEELEKEVLDALKPHSEDLKDLVIKSYGGKVFPNWIGDRSFIRLTSVRFENCMNLPPLGELPSLKKLVIQDMMGWEVLPTKSGVVGAVMFPCLEELYISSCPNLAEVSLEALPSLKELHLSSCPNLAEVSLEALPSLRVLYLHRCGDGVLRSLIRAASSVTKLSISWISGLSDEVWRGVMDYLGAVEELFILECNEMRYLWESEAEASKVLVNLRQLQVCQCSLVSLGEKEEEEDGCNQLTSLRMLELNHCQNLERCNLPNSIQELELSDCKNLERCNLPNNIQELSIDSCPLIASVSFPTGGHKLKSLSIDFCEQLPDTELLNTSMLEAVRIRGWKNLKSINKLTCFSQLTELMINDCSSIESFPAADLPNLTSLNYLSICDCENMDVDSFGDWPPNLGWLVMGGLKKPISKLIVGPQNFPPSLVRLILLGESAEEDDVTSGSQLSHMFPESLTYLDIRFFKKLETVSEGLQHLTSLQHLHIENCPKIQDLPEKLFPSLFKLLINSCPDELKEKTSRGGTYWPLISYIPEVYIN